MCWAGRPLPRGVLSWPWALLCCVHAEDVAWLQHAACPQLPSAAPDCQHPCPAPALRSPPVACLHSGGPDRLTPPLASPGSALL